MGVERLEVDCPTRLSVLFGTDDHAVTPGHRLTNRYWLDYAKFDIAVKVCLHLFLPVESYWDGGVVCYRFSLRVHHEFERGALH